MKNTVNLLKNDNCFKTNSSKDKLLIMKLYFCNQKKVISVLHEN